MSVEYDGLDTEAYRIAVGLGVYGPDGTENVLASQQTNVSDVDTLDSNAGSYTTQFNSVDVLGGSNWTASDFTDTTEGDGPEETSVRFVCLFEIFDSDGNAITPGGQPDAIFKEGTVTVSVTNETSSSGVGGSGNVSVGGEDQDP